MGKKSGKIFEKREKRILSTSLSNVLDTPLTCLFVVFKKITIWQIVPLHKYRFIVLNNKDKQMSDCDNKTFRNQQVTAFNFRSPFKQVTFSTTLERNYWQLALTQMQSLYHFVANFVLLLKIQGRFS